MKILLIGFSLFISGGYAFAGCVTDVTASTPIADFVDNGDGTVTHSKTGLMWKRCSEGQVWDGVNSTCTGIAATYTWQGSLQQAEVLNTTGGGFAGFTDWRVPNINELISIIEVQCWAPAVNLSIFPSTPANNGFWSSSQFPRVDLGYGVSSNGSYSGNHFRASGLHIRLVRGGL